MTTLKELIGYKNNLDEPTPWMNHESVMIGLVVTGMILMTICVALRIYVRFFVTQSPGRDDYCIIITTITAYAANIGCCLLAKAGLGRHFLLLGAGGMAKFTKAFWWCNAFYNLTLALVKLGLLFQYLRLIDGNTEIKQRTLRIIVVCLIYIVGAWGLIWTLLAWVPCNPVSAHWDFTDTTSACWGYGARLVSNFTATFYNHAASNMVLDILIISLPVASRSLRSTAGMQKKSRLALMALFALGGGSVLCSIIRFIIIVKFRATTYPTFDPTWYGPATTVLSVLEVDLATVVSALPVFWPHLRRHGASILITHEIEVRVARQSEFLDKSDSKHADISSDGARWGGDFGDNGAFRSDAVMLRDLTVTTIPRKPSRSHKRIRSMSKDSNEILIG